MNGKMVMTKHFDLKDKEYKIKLSKKLATVVSVKVNGCDVGNILWKPYELDLTPYIKEGNNEVELTLTLSLRNLLGPHHLEEGENFEVTPASFFKDEAVWKWLQKPWNDDYCFVESGVE